MQEQWTCKNSRVWRNRAKYWHGWEVASGVQVNGFECDGQSDNNEDEGDDREPDQDSVDWPVITTLIETQRLTKVLYYEWKAICMQRWWWRFVLWLENLLHRYLFIVCIRKGAIMLLIVHSRVFSLYFPPKIFYRLMQTQTIHTMEICNINVKPTLWMIGL